MLLSQDHKIVEQMEICLFIPESEDFVNPDSISTFISTRIGSVYYSNLPRTCFNVHS